ncbi:hypothetical protein [Aeromicrobium chenweiae]|uniref:Uncharacterized protein n=1 Tax=Aeromicrobium chenweiae TaxID=2079793 RepID=A0A2S0WIA9_9ACTN|nr:hypothetical protein [Aeromicrobium chenweiae]AWB91063.1 hypothetical protein C3E78_01845 [Aeromicrobium chenweiae]TGN31966.1 hypothetical protein E4L97_11355 [Aeromicrobium chenweiae]
MVGPSGSNRHLLGRSVVAGAPGVVWELMCRHDERNTPLSTLTRLLAEVGGRPDAGGADVVTRVRDVIGSSTSGRPTLLLGAPDFADLESLDALTDLAVSQDLRIVTAMTPETVATIPRLAALAERVDLGPLDRSTVARLLRARLLAEPHDVLVDFAHQRSRGAYGTLCQIGDLLEASDALVRAEGVVMIDPERIEDARLALPGRRRPASADWIGATPGIATLLDLVSLVGEVELAEASACLAEDDIAYAVRHGVLCLRDGVLTMSDPLEKEAVAAALSVARATELWQAYAHVLPASIRRPESLVRSVRWCRWAGQEVGHELVRAAARAANDRGLYRRTIEMTDPGSTSATAIQVQQERAHALTQVGDLTALAGLLASVDPAEVPEDELATFMRWSTRLVPADQRDAHRDRAIGPGHDVETRARRAVVVEIADLSVQAFTESRPAMIRRARSLTLNGTLSPINQAMAHSAASSLLRHAGRCAEAVHSGRAAVSLLESPEVDASSALLAPVREVLFIALVSAAELDEAQALLERYRELAVPYGADGRIGTLMSGMLALTHGRTDVALANAQLFLLSTATSDPLGYRGWLQALAAQTLALLGRQDEARAMLDSSEAWPVHQRRQSDLERRQAQAVAHDALADPERALEILDGIAAEAQEHGLLAAELDALGLAVLVDGPQRVRRLLAATDGLPGPAGETATWQQFARAVAAYDFGAMTALAEHLASTGREFLAGRIAQFTIDAGRRATDLSPAVRARLEQLVAGSTTPGL